MPRTSEMGDVTRLDPTARIPEAAGGAQRRVVASTQYVSPDTRLTVTQPLNKWQRLATSLGILGEGIDEVHKTSLDATDKAFEKGLAQGELKNAQGVSKEEAKALGEAVGWDRAEGAATGSRIAEQLAIMADDGKTAQERESYLQEQTKGLNSQDKNFLQALLPATQQGINRANAIDFNRARQAKEAAKEDALVQEARAAVNGLTAGDDLTSFNEKGRQFFSNASAMGIPREKAEKMAVDAVFEKAWDTMKDGNFNDTEEYLTLLSEKQCSGNTYLASPTNQEYILKKLAHVRDYMDREEGKAEQSQNEQRHKILEAEEVRANNEYIQDEPEILRIKKADLLEQKTDNYEALQTRNLNVRIIEGYLADAEQNQSHAERAAVKKQTVYEDKLLQDEMLNRNKMTSDELQSSFLNGDIGLQAYQKIKSYRVSAGSGFVQGIQSTFMGRLASYLPQTDELDADSVQETITLNDGTVLRPTRAQLESSFTDFAREFNDWYGQKQRDPVADRMDIENKREELANKALRPYGKKLYADGESPQTFLKNKEHVLPNREERNATWLEHNPQRKESLLRDYDSAPNDKIRIQWMSQALHPDEKKWVVEKVQFRMAAKEHERLQAEAAKTHMTQQMDEPGEGLRTIFRKHRASGRLEMIEVQATPDEKNGYSHFWDRLIFSAGNKLSPGSVALPRIHYPIIYESEKVKLSGIEAEKAYILRSLQDKSIPDHDDYFDNGAKNYTKPESFTDFVDGDVPAWSNHHKNMQKALNELRVEGAIVMDIKTGKYQINSSYDPLNAIRLMLEQDKKGK